MGGLSNRNIIVGITGGIAAYKAAQLVRDLQVRGASVRVVMTRGATEFITPLTLQALSGQPVHLDLLDEEAEMGMGHIELARWADLICVAPATADFIARLQAGRADDLLTTLCLATDAKLVLAPAMNQAMWRDPATTDNVASLLERGIQMYGPDDGSQACGDVGPGRMMEPGAIAEHLASLFETRLLEGQRVIITAGPTREALDPVRYISNNSSGRMGYAIANACALAGAHTMLISGPVNLDTPERVERIDVLTARDMYDAVHARMDDCSVFIGCAAVADYRPVAIAEQKIKKHEDAMHIELVKNPDIIASVAALADKPFTVGFAAETQDVEEYALGKLQNKKLDLIVANDVSSEEAGFNSQNNAATILSEHSREEIPLTSKQVLAERLVKTIAAQLPREID